MKTSTGLIVSAHVTVHRGRCVTPSPVSVQEISVPQATGEFLVKLVGHSSVLVQQLCSLYYWIIGLWI